jgi:hypothetical protein
MTQIISITTYESENPVEKPVLLSRMDRWTRKDVDIKPCRQRASVTEMPTLVQDSEKLWQNNEVEAECVALNRLGIQGLRRNTSR